jgi:lysophospholipase L1-like esterase
VNLSYHQSGSFTETELTDYYHRSLQIHKAVDAQVQPGAVLLIGDSFTQSLLSSTISPNSVNYGIAMHTTLGVLNRLFHYHSLNIASSIFIEIGINDFWRGRGNEDIIKNITSIVGQLPKNKQIILNALFPVDEEHGRAGWNARIIKINNSIMDLANANNLQFLSINSQLIDLSGQLQDRYHNGDGVHLTQKAYSLWSQAIKTQLLQ